MESRIAVISIIVENSDSVECLNRILHEYGIYIIGRMGIPYRQRGISTVSYTHLHMDEAWEALADPNIRVVAQIAPAVRVAVGDHYGLTKGCLLYTSR